MDLACPKDEEDGKPLKLPMSLQIWILCGATTRSCNRHPCCHSQQKAPDLEMNVTIPLSHWICSLILLVFTKIMLEVCQQEAWITLTFFLQHCVSPVLKVLWPESVMEEIKQVPITPQSIPRSGQCPCPHFSFFSSETRGTETLKCRGKLFLAFFCYFSKMLFVLFLWDHRVSVCTSSNSTESTFYISYMIIYPFIVGNPLENWVYAFLLSKVAVERETREWDERKLQVKVPVSYACEATVQALTRKV